MINYSDNFSVAISAPNKSPRFTVEIAFDNAATDFLYLTSHADCEVPNTATNVIYGCVQQPSGVSQRLNPLRATATIGSLNIPAIDRQGSLTAYIGNKLSIVDGIPTGDGLRGKRLRIYIGYAGLDWSDYTLPPGGTQLIQKITYDKGLYTFFCNDVQRSARKNIFEQKKTTLKANLPIGATTVTVSDASDFEMLEHDSSYSDAANSTVGYIKIDDEVIRYTGIVTGSGTEQFTGITRGVLGTLEAEHTVDLTADEDRRTEVEEYIYLQGPIIKILYAILTGNLYGQSGKRLPSNWHLNIPTIYINTAQFTGIGSDLWNLSDPTAGFQCRGQGLEKVDGKKFYEKELALLAGCFLPVTASGELGLRRISNVLHDASHVALLNNSNVVSVGALTHDMTQVHNQFNIAWNWDGDKFTRGSTLVDQDSITTHGASPPLDMKFKMLHGSTSTQVNLAMLRDSARDRYTGPPEIIHVECLSNLSGIDIGDIVRLETDQIRDYVSSSDISRAFEVQQSRVNWGTGEVSLDLFGSSQKADLIASSALSTVLPNTFYGPASGGTDISTVTAGILNAGIWHITSDSTLTGNADMTAAGAIFYYEGGVEIDDGVTLNIIDNVQLRVRDSITITGSGRINGVGGSTANSTITTGLGSAQSMGGINVRLIGENGDLSLEENGGAVLVSAENSSIPNIRIENTGSTLTGMPNDLRGISSPDGATNTGERPAIGGAGASGGAGLLIVTRDAFGNINSSIDLSGDDGNLGGSSSFVYGLNFFNVTVYGGSSGGGAPGGLFLILDGSNAIEAGFISSLTARQGEMPMVGRPMPPSGYFFPRTVESIHSSSIGNLYLPIEHADSYSRKQHAPPSIVASEDVPEYTSVPAAVNIVASAQTNNTLNVTALDLSVTPPNDGNYRGSKLEIYDSATSSWKPAGFVSNSEELTVYVPSAVTTYSVRAYPVSISGKESSEYASSSITLTGPDRDTVIGAGNKIITSTTTGNSTNGQGVEISTNGIKGYNSSGIAKFTLDPATGLMTAVDGTFSGTITSTNGAIGGWNIASGDLSAGGLILDSANARIRASNGSNYTEQSPAGFKAVDSVLGTTVDIPTNGNPPIFNNGVIKKTEYQLYTSSVIKTSADPATSGGSLINSSGIQLFNSGGARTAFLDAINSNHEFTGSITITPGSTGVSNLADAGALATQNTADYTSQVSGTKPPSDADKTSINTAANTSYVGTIPSVNVAGWAHSSDTTRIDGGNIYTGTIVASAINVSELSAISATLGTVNAGRIRSGSFNTTGAFLTAAVAYGATTIYVNDTSDFATSGNGQIIGSTNDRNFFNWTGKTATSLTGCSGILAQSTGSSVVPLTTGSKAILISDETNEMRFYGDIGNGSIQELANIGISQIGGDVVIGSFGNLSPGNNRIGIYSQSNSYIGMYGRSESGTGVYADSISGYALRAISSDSVGVYAISSGDTAIVADSGSDVSGAFKIAPKTTHPSTPPTSGSLGEFYVKNVGGNNSLQFHDGTTWRSIAFV